MTDRDTKLEDLLIKNDDDPKQIDLIVTDLADGTAAFTVINRAPYSEPNPYESLILTAIEAQGLRDWLSIWLEEYPAR